MVQIHDIKPKTRGKTKKRIGRGGKRGTYSGKGQKGQKSRAGAKLRPQTRDIIKKLPKLRGASARGYHMKAPKKDVSIVNIKDVQGVFKEGETVEPKTLVEKGLIKTRRGKLPTVKLLASGKITKKLLVKDCQISKAAEDKIKKAGGKVSLPKSKINLKTK